jgi:hypothetical protein
LENNEAESSNVDKHPLSPQWDRSILSTVFPSPLAGGR